MTIDFGILPTSIERKLPGLLTAGATAASYNYPFGKTNLYNRMHETKIALVIREDLPQWQKLNVAAFLASSVAIQFPETHGKSFVTASQSTYLPFLKQPILIYKANDDAQMKRAFQRAKERELSIGIYTRPLFATKNEEGNLMEIANYTDEEQDLVGLVVYGENRKVDKALKELSYHP
jgi:hypothetical protein